MQTELLPHRVGTSETGTTSAWQSMTTSRGRVEEDYFSPLTSRT